MEAAPIYEELTAKYGMDPLAAPDADDDPGMGAVGGDSDSDHVVRAIDSCISGK